MKRKLISLSMKDLFEELWQSSPKIKEILESSLSLRNARDSIFNYLNDLERQYFNIYSDEKFKDMHVAEKHVAKECIRVLKNVIRTENEELTGFSALSILYELSVNPRSVIRKVNEGFLLEFIHLFRGVHGKTDIFQERSKFLPRTNTSRNAVMRSHELDKYSSFMRGGFKKFRTGLEPELIRNMKANRKKILAYFKSSDEDWTNPVWQMKNIIGKYETISDLIYLEDDEKDGLLAAEKHGIPVQITPYYLSLLNKEGRCNYDCALRYQVIPTEYYCRCVAAKIAKGGKLDYMDEKSTSPVVCVTRRYPQIAILKPFNSCPQICVYCQRNWEISDFRHGHVTGKMLKKAIRWLSENKNIMEVLITGGDPLSLSNGNLYRLISWIAEMKHVKRIRIGTRALITLPFRIDYPFLEIMSRFHKWGKREICIVTHVESPAEITPDVMNAVKKIRFLGMNIYNQQVFTYYNSRRYETCFLRKTLKLCGIDPYYTFNTKGKEETVNFRVPIARIEQERKEEARLLPGTERLDEPVFNVPRLGKSHLRAWQDHEPLMILPDGRRVYRFYPWEERLRIADDYLYTDVSIYDYLKRLEEDGEDAGDYESIWYYF